MTWQNPWAWLGLLALAVPILVHLLARRTARVLPFPTLRFLTTSPLIATRRTRLTDLVLLAVRCAIILAAVAALAQPYLLSDERSAQATRSIVRAVVVDTSASMREPTANGARATDVARQHAAVIASASGASTIIETADVRSALVGAAAWLDTHSGRHELVVLSDFQRGTLDSLDVEGVPRRIGITLQRVATVRDSGQVEHVVPHGAVETVARVSLDANRTEVEWSRRAAQTTANGLTLAGAENDPDAAAVLRAARAYGAPAVPGDRPITITTPYDVSRDTALRVATPLSSPWMGDVVTQLARDPLLATVAADGHAASDAARGDPPGANWQTVVSAANGNPFIRVAAVNTNGRERLLLLSERGADDAATAALIVAASRAASSAMPVRELEPRTLSDAELADLQRTAETESRRNRAAGGSDGRWLWLVALMLLGIETWLRRRPAERAS